MVIGSSGNEGEGKVYEGTVINDEGEPPIVVETKSNIMLCVQASYLSWRFITQAWVWWPRLTPNNIVVSYFLL